MNYSKLFQAAADALRKAEPILPSVQEGEANYQKSILVNLCAEISEKFGMDFTNNKTYHFHSPRHAGGR